MFFCLIFSQLLISASAGGTYVYNLTLTDLIHVTPTLLGASSMVTYNIEYSNKSCNAQMNLIEKDRAYADRIVVTDSKERFEFGPALATEVNVTLTRSPPYMKIELTTTNESLMYYSLDIVPACNSVDGTTEVKKNGGKSGSGRSLSIFSSFIFLFLFSLLLK